MGRFFAAGGRTGPLRVLLWLLAGLLAAVALVSVLDSGSTLAFALAGSMAGAVLAKITAEVVRRFHDTGVRGGAGVAALVAGALVLAWVRVSDVALDLPWLPPVLTVAAAVLAAALLLRPGQRGPNRFGEPPAGALASSGGLASARSLVAAAISIGGGMLIGLTMISISNGMRAEREDTRAWLERRAAEGTR
jgi:uncharacterized membrane protein YhaH (DUF805 family)